MKSENLVVRLHDEVVGFLEPFKNGARFRFAESLSSAHPDSPLLSTALPVSSDPFPSDVTRNWFAGLLPEDVRAEEISRFFGVDADDYLSLLEEVGWECAGAVAVEPPDRNRAAVADDCFEEIGEVDLAKRLGALPGHPYDSAKTLRVSLGGFQEKICVSAQDAPSLESGFVRLEHVGIPLNGAISTHILKPQPDRFPGMIEGEAWAMRAAAYATATSEVALLENEDAPQTLVVKRFDRAMLDGRVVRLHQEDCAQALGLAPSGKYAAVSSPKKSDPSFSGIAKLLRMYSVDPMGDIEQLLRQMAVNVALGNTDAHAKNYALLHPDRQTITLAPMYDVVPALEITPETPYMGIRVNGLIRIDRLGRNDLVEESVKWGVPRRRACAVLDEVANQLKTGMKRASELYPRAGARHCGPALRRIDRILCGVNSV